jgi:ABC-type bacteriocin/lantibiotic exporter with double-glycine peptidase domain
MSVEAAIRTFLSDVVLARDTAAMPSPDCRNSEEWSQYFGVYFNLIGLPLKSAEDAPTNYPLLLATHPAWGPVLIKFTPSLSSEPRIGLLVLATGERISSAQIDINQLEGVRVLCERFTLVPPFSIWEAGRFVCWPVRRLMRQATLLQALTSAASSLLFIINFNILARVVPAGSLEAYQAILWLVAVSVGIMVLAQYMMNWVLIYLDSTIAERQEILRLSLLSSLRPKFIAEHGPARTLEFCGFIARCGRDFQRLVMTAISSLVIVPVLILMFIRLPGYLFVSAVLLSLVASAMLIWMGLRVHRDANDVAIAASEATNRLFLMIGNAQRLSFYNQVEIQIARWRKLRINAVNREYKMVSLKASGEAVYDLLTGVIHIGTIIAITLLIARLARENAPGALHVADAFIILHLVTHTFQLTPRVAEIVRRVGVIRQDLKSARALIDEVEDVNRDSGPHVTSPRVSVRFSQLRLPHGCCFSGDEALDLEVEDGAVVHISGESGSGKTTFLRCLIGLESPLSGIVRVFGADPCVLTPAERGRLFAYVRQDVQLLPGALRDSLNPMAVGGIAERDLWEALECVRLDEFVRKLPLGLNTPIADARRSLSTGERQRLILAQIVLNRRPILVLDEAMSGLPEDAERVIFENLRSRFEQIYLVSHRPLARDYADFTINLRSEHKV